MITVKLDGPLWDEQQGTAGESTVRKLVELGADLNKINRNLTPLGHAAENGHGNIVHMLLAAGAQANLTGHQMPTPWQLAISCGYDEIADDIARYANAGSSRKLINILPVGAADAMIDAAEAPLEADRALTAAVVKSDLVLVERLIKEGCSLRVVKRRLWSLLSFAISGKCWVIARRLIEAGAELNLSHKNDNSFANMPFMVAVTHNNVIEMMIRHGADVNIRYKEGSTPLL